MIQSTHGWKKILKIGALYRISDPTMIFKYIHNSCYIQLQEKFQN